MSDFVIVEYNDRVGGRTTQTNFGKQKNGKPYVVELGANWVRILSLSSRTVTDFADSRTGQSRRTRKPHLDTSKTQHTTLPTSTLTYQAKKYDLKNTYSNYSSILTYDHSGAVDFTDLLDEYETAYGNASVQAGAMLAENLQDEPVRAGLSLAGWKPKHSDMKRQAAEWWEWGN